jgi:hypothetical protein
VAITSFDISICPSFVFNSMDMNRSPFTMHAGYSHFTIVYTILKDKEEKQRKAVEKLSAAFFCLISLVIYCVNSL